MKIQKTTYYNNTFIGLFMKTSDELTLAPSQAPAKNAQQITDVLGTRVLHLLINQSPLLGLFSAINSKGCVLCRAAEEKEAKLLRKEGLNVLRMTGQFAPGNVILANDRSALVSTLISKKEAQKIGDALGVEVFQHEISGIKTIGATNVVTNKGFFAYNDITEIEFKHLEKIFGVKGVPGTSNMGTPFNALGVVANGKGALVGELTSGFEIQRVYEALAGDE